MDINYRKNDNSRLFKDFMDENLLNIKEIQNYIPIYNNFFNLTEKNYRNINLNNINKLCSLKKKLSNNKFIGTISNSKSDDDTDFNIEIPVFFKLSPLLDPIKYMMDKYDIDNPYLLNLPQFDSTNCHKKTLDYNNSAYIDGFFTYLTSQLLHYHKFIHGLDYYGSFLALKKDYLVNIYDDLDYLNDSNAFHKNINNLFTLDNNSHYDMLNFDTRNNKRALKIHDNDIEKNIEKNIDKNINENIDNNINENSISNCIIELSDIEDLNKFSKIFISNNSKDNQCTNDLIFKSNIENCSSHNTNSSSSCSSRTSNTNNDESNNDSETNTNTDNTSYSTASDDEMFASIKRFPIQIISLEYCEKTLDSLISDENIKDEEWDSIILQILMILITYQKLFNMTHNDLHTNNIMYINTDKKHLYYKINNKHYKVPTFGRIFKIIDFGRAIYTFKSNLLCSDSYEKDGDASTQYNFGPYMDENKPRLEPNYSFDLCRLACSLFDFLVDDLDKLPKIKSPIKKIMISWCYDDKNRNILYKNDGDERYPDFKLYKMISRSVHNHVPLEQLSKHSEHFDKYLIAKKRINNGFIMNIDDLPIYI